ncbi:MAG: DUF5928 domain-containing protein, partial [Pseudomonadota bacterium]
LPAFDHVFDTVDAPLPDLGGIETTLPKRRRHPRALLRVLYRRLGTERAALCLDPAEHTLLLDMAADGADLRLLVLDPDLSPDALARRALAGGLMGRDTAAPDRDTLLAALARDLTAQTDRLARADLPMVRRVARDTPPDTIADHLSDLLGIDAATARALAADAVRPHL